MRGCMCAEGGETRRTFIPRPPSSRGVYAMSTNTTLKDEATKPSIHCAPQRARMTGRAIRARKPGGFSVGIRGSSTSPGSGSTLNGGSTGIDFAALCGCVCPMMSAMDKGRKS